MERGPHRVVVRDLERGFERQSERVLQVEHAPHAEVLGGGRLGEHDVVVGLRAAGVGGHARHRPAHA
ncbi:MAG: hypothetical protein ACK56I_04110, partial [bacterium]